MDFTVHGRRLVLRGTTSLGLKTVRRQRLQDTLSAGVHISMIQMCDKSESTLLHSLSTHAESSNIPDNIGRMLLDFDDVFQEPSTLPPKRIDHDHRIPLVQGTNPKDIIDGLIQQYLKSGIIQNSCSSYSSLVVLVGKKDEGWRLCIDYRELNKRTVKNRFPIPLVDDLLDELHGSKFFSKLDLHFGYNQVRMVDEDIHKTTFKTHSGHYEYLVMPFGLTNAPATFQGLMNAIFQEFLRKLVLIFFDDILVYNTSMEDHLVHLHKVLSTLRNYSLFAKKSKCYFGVTRVKYLGHFISADGVATDPAKIVVVQQWPLPQSGFKWTNEAKDAFQKLKTQLSNTLVLALPNFSKDFILEVDVSRQGKWRHYLIPKRFTIRTDNQSLKYILDQRLTTAFKQKWLVKLMEFDFNIEYKQGRENIAADALSRIECATIFTHQPTFELLKFIKDTWQTDIDLKRIITEL
ncbi:hypothetical protein V8G54_014625 [Vigna mungo]|uniref:Reverse transcriptase domain-containing protein n=1 Tax=Vigna mungo TaxID=3915 RepID=A0AAQ3NGZ7_VIGMU